MGWQGPMAHLAYTQAVTSRLSLGAEAGLANGGATPTYTSSFKCATPACCCYFVISIYSVLSKKKSLFNSFALGNVINSKFSTALVLRKVSVDAPFFMFTLFVFPGTSGQPTHGWGR